ncbi:MAG: response regulator [Eubacterium sp.]|nr:response regulator [Eubacterium sp.]
MKQILIIGKFNSVFEDIAATLKLEYHVQMCVDNVDMVKGLLRLNQLDAIVFSLMGLDTDGRKIMTELQYNYSQLPVLCVGSQIDKSIYGEFFQLPQFCWINRDTFNQELLSIVAERMRVAEKMKPREATGERKVVMVIDDNPILLRSMNGILSTHYDVMLANSGMKAMTMIGQKVPDVVFLDCEMPICDGKMTYKMLKDLDEMKEVPIIFLTGINDANYIQDALRLQPAGYLLKPASKDRIYDTLRQVLQKK